MRRTVAPLVLGLALVSPGVEAGDSIRHYEIRAEIAPDRAWLHARVAITLVAGEEGLSELDAVLNRGLAVRSASCDEGVRSFHFDRAAASTYQYAPTAAPLRVELDRPLKGGESTELVLDYEGRIEAHSWGVNALGDAWVELGLYTAWFPYDPGSTHFTSEVRLKVDDGFTVTGSGSVERVAEGWSLVQDRPSDDTVIVAARDLRVRRAGDERLAIEIWHTDLTDEQAGKIADEISEVVRSYEGWFGPASARKLTVVFARRTRGGGYARPGFLSLVYDPASGERRGLLKQIAHEVAHFWWHRAPTTTWEDWLNEGFAEYSALLVLRHRYGEGAFTEKLTAYEPAAAKAPPIWGLARDDDEAYAALYQKGSLLLYGLEKRVGEKRLLDVMAAGSRREVASTRDFLSTLESMTSRPVREDFEARLKR
jgi:aminopeptidase N